jgi:hypothetical protein
MDIYFRKFAYSVVAEMRNFSSSQLTRLPLTISVSTLIKRANEMLRLGDYSYLAKTQTTGLLKKYN